MYTALKGRIIPGEQSAINYYVSFSAMFCSFTDDE